MKISPVLTASAVVLTSALFTAPVAQAANWSSTKLEVLSGSNYEFRNDESQSILTLANASGFDYGDTFIFADYGDWRDSDGTDGIHSELSGRLSFLRTFGDGAWKDGAIKDIYAIMQFDITGNKFANKTVDMFGVSIDWALPEFRFFKTHLQTRDDPTHDETSTQLNLVWNKGFNIGEAAFTFEGFLDYTTESDKKGGGISASNTLTQPTVVYHVNKHVALGIEYQYWQNRLGVEGNDEKVTQLLARWTF